MEIIIGLLIVCGLGYYLVRKSSQAKDVVESAPVVSAPYKVPEPALATIIPLVTTPAPVVAKKPRAKKPAQPVAQAPKAPAKPVAPKGTVRKESTAPVKPAAMKAPAKAKPKAPAKPKAK